MNIFLVTVAWVIVALGGYFAVYQIICTEKVPVGISGVIIHLYLSAMAVYGMYCWIYH